MSWNIERHDDNEILLHCSKERRGGWEQDIDLSTSVLNPQNTLYIYNYKNRQQGNRHGRKATSPRQPPLSQCAPQRSQTAEGPAGTVAADEPRWRKLDRRPRRSGHALSGGARKQPRAAPSRPPRSRADRAGSARWHGRWPNPSSGESPHHGALSQHGRVGVLFVLCRGMNKDTITTR